MSQNNLALATSNVFRVNSQSSLSNRMSFWSRMSFGERLIFLYFGAFYFGPMVIDALFDLKIKYVLSGDLNFFWPFILSALYLLLFYWLRKVMGRGRGVSLPFAKFASSNAVVTVVFLAFFALAYEFSSTFSTAFRHTESYSSAGIVPVATFALKTVCAIYVFASLSSRSVIEIKFYHVLLFVWGLYFAFVSSNDVVHAFVAIYSLFQNSRIELARLARALVPKVGLPAIIIILPGVVFAGIANKVGIDAALTRFSSGGIQYLVELFANRIFYHSYTFAYHINNFEESFALGWQAMEIISFQSFRRLEILFGGEVVNETLQTVSRLNYLQITPFDNGTGAGASPGLLGSLFYFPGGVLSLPLHMFYVYAVATAFDRLMGGGRYGLPVYLGGLVVLQAVVDTIVDNFNPFSVGFVALAMLLVLSTRAGSVLRKDER